MVPETRPSRSLTINHTSILELLGSARASVPARYSASRPLAERASLGLCAGTRHPEQRFTVHRSRAMACLAIGAPLSMPIAELAGAKLGQRLSGERYKAVARRGIA